ncbi:MAG: arylsulfatase [Steroidobacteraceae bacterium]
MGKVLAAAFSLASLAAPPGLAQERHEVVLPKPPAPFTGTIGRTYADSTPAAPQLVRAPEGAPNVLLVMTDDVGFAASSTYGGPIPTPNLDQLAAAGLRYNRFHTTAMCSPTRAALLTGRNHHAVGSGVVTDLAAGYPGYSGIIPKSAATVAEVLKQNGYSTAMFGKHHNVQPGANSEAGPFDQWPLGLGFDYFYGFVAAETNQFIPALYRGTTRIAAPPGEMLDRALADDAIRWVHNQQAGAPGRPFFIYYAPGTAHAPHQAPKEWIAKFKGRFDQGWDRLREEIFARQKSLGIVPANTLLTPRPPGVPAWDTVSPGLKRVTARMMEVYAAMLAYQDHEFGRLIDELARIGELDNTLVIFIEGDNGASAEGGVFGHTNPMGGFANGVDETESELLAMIDELGGPETVENWAAGWAWATNTPLRWTKQIASHLGGTRNGLVVSWPAHIAARGLRGQFHHVVDIAPTILEAAGLPQPQVVNGINQQRVDGVSMVYSFASADVPGRHTTQYFEMMGNRAIYHDGWMASTTPTRVTWLREPLAVKATPADYDWELYDLDHDFSQAHNLATQYPGKLAELRALFEQEARRNNVYPLDDRLNLARFAAAVALGPKPRSSYVYRGKGVSVPADLAPSLRGSFTLTAEIGSGHDTARGVLAALGGKFAGWSFYLHDGYPVVTMAGANRPDRIFRVAGDAAVPPGASIVRYEFASEGIGRGGLMRISIDGREVGQGRIERTIVRTVEMTDTFDVGFDGDTPVSGDYVDEGRFTGEIHKLTVEQRPAASAPPARH